MRGSVFEPQFELVATKVFGRPDYEQDPRFMAIEWELSRQGSFADALCPISVVINGTPIRYKKTANASAFPPFIVLFSVSADDAKIHFHDAYMAQPLVRRLAAVP